MPHIQRASLFVHPSDLIDADNIVGEESKYQLDGIGEINPAALLAVLVLLAPDNPRSTRSWRISLIKLSVLCHEILNEVREVPSSDIAKALGVTPAALSWRATQIRDFMGGTSAGKSEAARAKLSVATKRAWIRRKTSNAKAGGAVSASTPSQGDAAQSPPRGA